MKIQNFYILLLVAFLSSSCKKLIEINEPKNKLTIDKVFENDQTATAVVSNIYGLFNEGVSINGNFTPQIGLYTDELISNNSFHTVADFYNGAVNPGNSFNLNIWKGFYSVIYQSNALLEGIKNSKNITTHTNNRLSGEAKYFRALSYFYLMNLYGDVPLILSTDVNISSVKVRTPSREIHIQIISDLEDSRKLLENVTTYSDKVRANQWSVSALLSRLYLYNKDWNKAEIEASHIINSGHYSLVPIQDVFKKNSKETILEFWTQNGFTRQATLFYPSSGISSYFLSPQLTNYFDSTDSRRLNWITPRVVGNTTYLLSSKYKKITTSMGIDGEYLVFSRFSEIYLNRSEARAELNNILGAVEDLNKVRKRAGLTEVDFSISKDSCISIIKSERKKELFTEWGHRFFDLKRWGDLYPLMNSIKSTWKSHATLLPIPQNEINVNPNLIQNPGY